MAEEPQPAGVHEGADAAPAPTSAEDRKTQAAMSKLDAPQNEDDTTGKKDVDTEALEKATKNLDVKGGEKKPEPAKKAVKVDQADVTLQVDQLDLTKPKATDLLKAHDADPVKAMTAFIGAAA
ncbi:uncharacterized protein K452DRAFT_288415 [Aplosporella prunicola CBS 121167]|uniref:Nascent polypeptide-associated complex subunit alpha-like UBA domain-containing protein n=1 Tax=Aplosporella prunicola CBS 121167 TaxID=1176127 RepID=A0A6A6BA02_9PEZI|nr:uncharacterized protein K452DRAFT_288415 [Aplosporella prunicola CBS 121167]KAF2141029.1 hypothetical protein K452DRAFT_288415 [Aplosporella prunicola CBS 121167]